VVLVATVVSGRKVVALSSGQFLVLAEQQQLPRRSGGCTDAAQASGAGDFRPCRRQGRWQPPCHPSPAEKFGNEFLTDPLPKRDRVHGAAGPDDGVNARVAEGCPRGGSQRGNIGHLTTIRSRTDTKSDIADV
jgi:hypothetical protein